MTGYAGALLMLNNNAFVGRGGQKPRYVVLHGTAGGSSAQNIAAYFQSTQGTQNPVSATYVDGPDGVIVQCNDENDGAWGNGIATAGHASYWDQYLNAGINLNNITISIEHVKSNTDNSNQLTVAQQAASFKLIADICNRWGIPTHAAGPDGGITGHFAIDPVNRSDCPGPYPWDALWSYLNNNSQTQEVDVVIELNTPGVSQYFAPSANGYWRCNQTQKRIGGSILSFYKRFGNAGLCGLTYLGLPMTDETSIGNGATGQAFERGIVFYDPNHAYDTAPGGSAVYVAHIDKGIGQQWVTASVQAKLTSLQGAYNKVVTEKNQLVADKLALQQQVASLQQQLAAAQASGGDTTTLKQQISALQTKIAKATAALA